MTYRASAIAAHVPAPSQGVATGAQGADLARCNPHGINGLAPVGSDNGSYVNLETYFGWKSVTRLTIGPESVNKLTISGFRSTDLARPAGPGAGNNQVVGEDSPSPALFQPHPSPAPAQAQRPSQASLGVDP